VKYATTKIGKFVEKVWLFLYESIYSKETLKYYFDKDWFDDDYIESEKRKKNEVSYSKKSKFQPYRCPKCKRPWRFYTLPKGKVPMREFLGDRVPMEHQACPEELPCKIVK
jgi:hypothetical protein|tara:strand:+ start:803 stop:1135 length:333 start_codon:yes stop_codon:yes gene_type:complete